MTRGIGALVLDRVFARVRTDERGCWVYAGAKTSNGYGHVNTGGTPRFRYTHRLVYEEMVGSIPLGTEIDHLCRNRACCNPEHLEAVSHVENVRRGVAARRARAA